MNLSRAILGATIAATVMLPHGASAESPEAPPDVTVALEHMSKDGRPITFSVGDYEIPPGGHLQGVQMRYDAAGKRHLAFLSHDSENYAYLLAVAFPANSSDQFSPAGRVIHLQRLPSDGQSPPLRHAGGFQILGNTLVVGVEDNQDKRRSQIQFWDVSKPDAMVQLEHLIVSRVSSQPKDVTAGAVGLAALESGHHLLAVANWDSRAIDFYKTNGKPLADPQCQFAFAFRWAAAGADVDGWQPDSSFATYQSINLVTDSRGKLYLLGFDTVFGVQDVIDLYSVHLGESPEKCLRKLLRKKMRLTDENHFRFGGGAWIHGCSVTILSTERNIGAETTLNVAD